MKDKTGKLERRILVYAPVGKDAQMASQVLATAGIEPFICHDFPDLLAALQSGVGAVLTVEEALAAGALTPLAQYVACQPTWSDIPILLMTLHGADSVGLDDAVETLGNLTLLERPVRTAALISAARSALRARMRQYQVREADQRKDEFIASLGHELRNPLAPIRTSMLILKRMYPAASGVTQIREVVERQVNHLTRLVDDLLDVARITNGKVVLQRERTALSMVIGHAVEICASLLENTQRKIDVSQPTQPVLLNADPVRLVQSLANILANAIKYTIQPGTIGFNAHVDGENVIFRIRDSGIGLEKASLSRIFEMFAQSHQVPGRVPGGLGIGLSLAKQFTEMHGGTITAKSDGPGQGSEFVLTLPIVVSADGAANGRYDQTIKTEADTFGNRRVLVVDDNRDGADMLQRLFEADGFTVATAYDGQEAVETVKRSAPDIVVMDIGMPGMDGYEAVRHIRAQPGGKNILMIALTGWGQESTRRLAAEAGFDHHMVKPVDFDVLKSFLECAPKPDASPHPNVPSCATPR
jgi:signal transduction histidine kinase/ActR/RegA family two-component response regulator